MLGLQLNHVNIKGLQVKWNDVICKCTHILNFERFNLYSLFIMLYLIMSCHVRPSHVLSFHVKLYHIPYIVYIISPIILYCIVLYCIVLYRTVLYCIIIENFGYVEGTKILFPWNDLAYKQFKVIGFSKIDNLEGMFYFVYIASCEFNDVKLTHLGFKCLYLGENFCSWM